MEDSPPIQGGVVIILVTSLCYRRGEIQSDDSVLYRKQTLPLPFYISGIPLIHGHQLQGLLHRVHLESPENLAWGYLCLQRTYVGVRCPDGLGDKECHFPSVERLQTHRYFSVQRGIPVRPWNDNCQRGGL